MFLEFVKAHVVGGEPFADRSTRIGQVVRNQLSTIARTSEGNVINIAPKAAVARY